MAKTLLNSVNQILKRVGNVQGDADALVTLTSGARQRSIDVAIQVINEGIDELYSSCNMAQPKELGSSTITLVTNDRDYTVATDLVQIRWPLIDKTNDQYIWPYPGGYEQMLLDDPGQEWTGLPHYGVISPEDGTLYLDRLPTSAENGNIYTYKYDKELELSAASDTVPFGNAVWRAMVPAWVQLYRRDIQYEFDANLFTLSIGRAARLLSQNQMRSSYARR